jgi:hypothetical protein
VLKFIKNYKFLNLCIMCYKVRIRKESYIVRLHDEILLIKLKVTFVDGNSDQAHVYCLRITE